jgi:hypothetical protein
MIINELGDGSVGVDGIDGIMLRVLSQKLNFNVELHMSPDVMWGDIYENGTSTGETNFISNNHAMKVFIFRRD